VVRIGGKERDRRAEGDAVRVEPIGNDGGIVPELRYQKPAVRTAADGVEFVDAVRQERVDRAEVAAVCVEAIGNRVAGAAGVERIVRLPSHDEKCRGAAARGPGVAL